LAIAATCEKDDLTSLGGNAGAALFERSREVPQSSPADTRANGRAKNYSGGRAASLAPEWLATKWQLNILGNARNFH
jgi:hypothetical protein